MEFSLQQAGIAAGKIIGVSKSVVSGLYHKVMAAGESLVEGYTSRIMCNTSTYSNAFKLKAAKRSQEVGSYVAGKEFNCASGTIRTWRRGFEADGRLERINGFSVSPQKRKVLPLRTSKSSVKKASKMNKSPKKSTEAAVTFGLNIPGKDMSVGLVDRDTNTYVVEYCCQWWIEGEELLLRVKWKNWEQRYNTWEPVRNLVEDCPDLVESYMNYIYYSKSNSRAFELYDKVRKDLGLPDESVRPIGRKYPRSPAKSSSKKVAKGSTFDSTRSARKPFTPVLNSTPRAPSYSRRRSRPRTIFSPPPPQLGTLRGRGRPRKNVLPKRRDASSSLVPASSSAPVPSAAQAEAPLPVAPSPPPAKVRVVKPGPDLTYHTIMSVTRVKWGHLTIPCLSASKFEKYPDLALSVVEISGRFDLAEIPVPAYWVKDGREGEQDKKKVIFREVAERYIPEVFNAYLFTTLIGPPSLENWEI